MAVEDITVAFIKQFESEVHLAYQQTGTLLRNTVRVKNNVNGSSTVFQKVGKGTASTKARNGTINPMQAKHETCEVTLSDWYAGDWVDKLDEAKINHDERKVIAQTGAYALGRKTDELIIEALNKAKNDAGDNTTGLTKAKVMKAFAMLNESDVPDDGQRYAVVSPLQWNDLMNIPEFAKSDYVSDKPFMKGRECRKWLGINWMMHTALPLTSKVRTAFMYHSSAIGHAVGADVTTDIQWHNDHAAHFINNMMSQGAGLIDDSGVIKITSLEGAAEQASGDESQGS